MSTAAAVRLPENFSDSEVIVTGEVQARGGPGRQTTAEGAWEVEPSLSLDLSQPQPTSGGHQISQHNHGSICPASRGRPGDTRRCHLPDCEPPKAHSKPHLLVSGLIVLLRPPG